MIENLIRKQYDIILGGPSGGHDKQIKKSERVLIAEFRERFAPYAVRNAQRIRALLWITMVVMCGLYIFDAISFSVVVIITVSLFGGLLYMYNEPIWVSRKTKDALRKVIDKNKSINHIVVKRKLEYKSDGEGIDAVLRDVLTP